jgi:hypothetical protein
MRTLRICLAETSRMPFSQNLRRLRPGRFLSLAELAHQSHLHTVTLSHLEAVRAEPCACRRRSDAVSRVCAGHGSRLGARQGTTLTAWRYAAYARLVVMVATRSPAAGPCQYDASHRAADRFTGDLVGTDVDTASDPRIADLCHERLVVARLAWEE